MIAKKVIDNRELDKWLAIHVMGWQEREYKYILYWYEGNERKAPVDGWEHWAPSTSISNAFVVVEKLCEKDIVISLMDQLGYESDEEGNIRKNKLWRVQFMDLVAHSESFDNSKIWFEMVENESLPRAILLAAKRAVEGKE